MTAREAFSIAAEVSHSADIFCSKMMVDLYTVILDLYTVIQEMSSFPMRVANNFCDLPLSKYLDSKTVLIYCPHPVDSRSLFRLPYDLYGHSHGLYYHPYGLYWDFHGLYYTHGLH